MDAKLRNFSELYNILSVKSLLRTNLKAFLTDWRMDNYYYRMLYRATIDRHKFFFENLLQASWCYL